MVKVSAPYASRCTYASSTSEQAPTSVPSTLCNVDAGCFLAQKQKKSKFTQVNSSNVGMKFAPYVLSPLVEVAYLNMRISRLCNSPARSQKVDQLNSDFHPFFVLP